MPKTFSVLVFLAYTVHGRRMQSPEKPLQNIFRDSQTLADRDLNSLKGLLLRLMMFSSIVAFDPSTLKSRLPKLTNVRLRPVIGVASSTISMDNEIPSHRKFGSFPRLRPIEHATPIFGETPMITYLDLKVETDVVDVGLQHGELLPASFTSRIPSRDEGILRFVLSYLQAEGLDNLTVSITGGYVRDLLMGKEPDDLDLSLDLRGCSNETTVTGLLDKIDEFAKQRPDLGIEEVDIKTHLNKDAQKKQIDSFKALFHNRGQISEVDVLPTCGDETYEVGSRIPYRNWRASPQEDALRRDLTVGAMFLQVEQDVSCAANLSFRLFDFYGGVADLATGTLRAPVPTDESYESLSAMVLRTEDQRDLATALGLSSLPEPQAVQTLWWAKALMDDPIRVCRAIRFSATLRGFELHRTFWDAVPFALLALHGSVAGSRKMKEYVKIAEHSFEACVYFVELAFTQKFGPSKPLEIRDSGLHGELSLASSLFGGRRDDGQVKSLPEHHDFDIVAFRTVAASLAPAEDSNPDPDELLVGLLLAAAASAVGLECSEEEFESMCLTGQMKKTGFHTVSTARKWATEKNTPNVIESGFAAACGIPGADMHLYSVLWVDVFCSLPPMSLHRRELVYRLAQRFVTQKEPSDSRQLARLAEALWVVSRVRPPVRGGVFATPNEVTVPFKLRKQVMALLEVGTRLLGYDAPLETAEDLQAFFSKYPKICAALSQQNLDSLEPPFQPNKKKKKYK